jgi:hypothetical protein
MARKLARTLTLAVFGIAISSGATWAQRPASVVGNWSTVANQTLITLQIVSQGATGPCRDIAGALGGSGIEGFYCPSTGRVSFLRKNSANNDTFQVYTGNVGTRGSVDRMAGTFVQATNPGAGEYNFSATRP